MRSTIPPTPVGHLGQRSRSPRAWALGWPRDVGDAWRPGRAMGAAAPRVSLARRYERGWLRGDLLAGVTVAAYVIPQVKAYTEVAGLPAVVGLWASVAACWSTPPSAR